MDVTKRLAPGKDGTKRYVKRFGECLLYVRYRHDRQTQKRYTTVELIVDEQALRPQVPRHQILFPLVTENVYVRINYHENEFRQQVKQSGAIWLVEQKRWKMRRQARFATQLTASLANVMPKNNSEVL